MSQSVPSTRRARFPSRPLTSLPILCAQCVCVRFSLYPPISSEVSLHVWMDSSLLELTALLLLSLPPTLPPPPSFPIPTLSYSLVYPDKRGIHVLREVGVVKGVGGGDDGEKTLKDCGLEIGDHIDVAISTGQGVSAEGVEISSETSGEGRETALGGGAGGEEGGRSGEGGGREGEMGVRDEGVS